VSEKELKNYLSGFPHEKVDVCFAMGSYTMLGREGACYCANCDSYLHDVYGDDSYAPFKDEALGHCENCLAQPNNNQ
jgi:hypothetical protein